MPLGGIKPTVRISLLEEEPADYRCTVADRVHGAMGNLQPGLTSVPGPGFPRWMDQQEMVDIFVSSEAQLYLLESKGSSQ
jgi:hypothetical protein